MATGFRRLFLCFSFFLTGLQDPLLLLPSWPSALFSCVGGRRNHQPTKRDREHTTSGAATNDQGNSRQQQGRLRLERACGCPLRINA